MRKKSDGRTGVITAVTVRVLAGASWVLLSALLLPSAFIASAQARDPDGIGPPQRIVSIGGALTEIIYELGAEAALVGNDTTSYHPPQAENLPKVGYPRTLSAEGVLSLEPDLVILNDEAGPPAVIRQLESTGVAILRLKAGRTLQDVKHSVAVIGGAVGREARARELIKRIEADNLRLDALREAATVCDRTLFIMQPSAGGTPMAAGTDTAAAAFLELAGAGNVVKGYSGYKPLTPEAAVSLGPQVIVTTARGAASPDAESSLLKSPGLSLTPAAAARRLIAMDTLFMLGFGPRIVKAALELNQTCRGL